MISKLKNAIKGKLYVFMFIYLKKKIKLIALPMVPSFYLHWRGLRALFGALMVIMMPRCATNI